MPTVTLDNITYDFDQLNEEAKQQITSLRFVDLEISRLQSQMAVLQTARNAYARALKRALEQNPHDLGESKINTAEL